jgi:predicted nucleotidyltransferase
MIGLLTQNMENIAKLCEKYDIRTLEVFGSAVTDTWNAETSDLDFIVDFGDYSTGDAFRLVDFAQNLEELLGRRVDLLTAGPIRNPYLREAISEQKVTIYAARDSQTAA